VAKTGQPLDVLRTAPRETEAAWRLLTQAIRRHGVPATIPSDGSEANAAAIKRDNEAHGTHISIRQGNYWPNSVDQDQRAIQRVTRLMRGFKAFEAAQRRLVGMELMHRLQQGQLVSAAGVEGFTPAEQCSLLAA